MWSFGLLLLVFGYAALYTGIASINALRTGATPPKLSDELGLPALYATTGQTPGTNPWWIFSNTSQAGNATQPTTTVNEQGNRA